MAVAGDHPRWVRLGHWLFFLPSGLLNLAGEAWVEHRSIRQAWREWLS